MYRKGDKPWQLLVSMTTSKMSCWVHPWCPLVHHHLHQHEWLRQKIETIADHCTKFKSAIIFLLSWLISCKWLIKHNVMQVRNEVRTTPCKVNPSCSSALRLIIVGVSHKSKSQVTSFVFSCQVVTETLNIVFNSLNVATHWTSAVHQKADINLCVVVCTEKLQLDTLHCFQIEQCIYIHTAIVILEIYAKLVIYAIFGILWSMQF